MFKLNCVVAVLMLSKCGESAWSQFENLDGGVNHVASASWAPGRLDIFGVDNNRQTWHKSFSDGSWSGWENLGGATTEKPGAFSIKSNWVDVMIRGTDRNLYRKTWNGQAWTDWQMNTNGGLLNSGPTLTASAGDTNNLHVFVVGSDYQLLHCIVRISDGTWTIWEQLGGGLVGDPAAVSWGTNRFDVFSIAPDNQMWQKTYDNGWQEWRVMAGGQFKPGVGATSTKHGSLSVFGKGLDDAIYSFTYANDRWQPLEGVGGLIRSSPSAVATSSTRVDLFGVGRDDGRVYRSFSDSKPGDSSAESFGCYRGYCWSKCTEWFGGLMWCYTTKGYSQDFNYVRCETFSDCKFEWACAGSCTY